MDSDGEPAREPDAARVLDAATAVDDDADDDGDDDASDANTALLSSAVSSLT